MKNHIVIIGGTSGIGLALSQRHLQQGWQVTIIGSNATKIHAIDTQYPHHDDLSLLQLDISSAHERQALYAHLDNVPFCRLVYAAGVYFNERKTTLSAAESEKILAVNLQAFGEIFYHASECLKRHQSAYPDKPYHLVAIASVAGLLDFHHASLYARCKSAMIQTCRAYRMGLAPFNIHVICIASGYVDTDRLRQLNGGRADNKPFLCSVARAIDEIEYAITHNTDVHIFPKRMKYLVRALSALPRPILDKVMQLQYHHQNKGSHQK